MSNDNIVTYSFDICHEIILLFFFSWIAAAFSVALALLISYIFAFAPFKLWCGVAIKGANISFFWLLLIVRCISHLVNYEYRGIKLLSDGIFVTCFTYKINPCICTSWSDEIYWMMLVVTCRLMVLLNLNTFLGNYLVHILFLMYSALNFDIINLWESENFSER